MHKHYLLKWTSRHIWDFMNLLEKAHAVFKTCLSKIKYLGNTINPRNHINHFYPELTFTTRKNTASPANAPLIEDEENHHTLTVE